MAKAQSRPLASLSLPIPSLFHRNSIIIPSIKWSSSNLLVCCGLFFLLVSPKATMQFANANKTSTAYEATARHRGEGSAAAADDVQQQNVMIPALAANRDEFVGGSGGNSMLAEMGPDNNNNIGTLYSSQQQQQQGRDFFREYLSRGMFGCATKYVSVLQKLNKLIANAHKEYSQCQNQIAQADRSAQSLQQSKKLAAQLDMINEMFNDEP